MIYEAGTPVAPGAPLPIGPAAEPLSKNKEKDESAAWEPTSP